MPFRRRGYRGGFIRHLRIDKESIFFAALNKAVYKLNKPVFVVSKAVKGNIKKIQKIERTGLVLREDSRRPGPVLIFIRVIIWNLYIC